MPQTAATPPDVPSPIDLHRMDDACAWAATAMTTRPHRVEFFGKALASNPFQIQSHSVQP